MTGSEIIELVKSKIHYTWKAISIDGSAFDSSQFAELMKAVDNLFWKLMRPFVRDIIQHNWDHFPVDPLVPVDDIVENMMRALLSTENVVFVHAPTVNAPDWPEHIRRKFFKDVAQAH